MDEGDVVSGAYLAVDPLRAGADLCAPQGHARGGRRLHPPADDRGVSKTIAQSQSITNVALIIFACVIAAGVIYNGARIALSERSRELASLRVLGFTRAEVGRILIGEQAMLTALAVPFGFVLGRMAVVAVGAGLHVGALSHAAHASAPRPTPSPSASWPWRPSPRACWYCGASVPSISSRS